MRGEGATEPPMLLSAVVPIHNEEASLRAVDSELRRVLAGLPGPCEIVYVDDGSTDGSHAVLRQIHREHSGSAVATTVVRLRRTFGQTAAMAAGFAIVRGQVVVALDGDGQNNPEDIPRLMAKLDEGHDVVSGWRRRRKDARLTRVLPSRAANWLIGRVTGLRLHDYGCTLKAYRGAALSEIHLYGEMHRFIPVYLAQVGARVAELEVDHRPRLAGASKYGSRRIVKVVLDLFLVLFMSRYFSRPMHFFGQVAAAFTAALAVLIALMVAFKLGWLALLGIPYQADFVETPLPAIAATFFTAAALAVFLGVLAEILIRIYFEMQGRHLQPYWIAEILAPGGPQAAAEPAASLAAPAGDEVGKQARPR